MKWRREMDISGNRVIKLLTAVLLLMAIPCLAYAGYLCQTPDQCTDEDAASEITSSTTGSMYSSGTNINNYAIQPIMSPNTQMTTADGTQTFNAHLLCPSTPVLATVYISLPNGDGDIPSITITQDTNYSGVVNWTYNSSANGGIPRISGVCANGVISCDAGATWTNCNYYQWMANINGQTNDQVELQSVGQEALGGCYCIDSHCGSNLVISNFTNIMQSLGSGVVGAIQAVDPQQAITNASQNFNTLSATFYGQGTSSCASMNGEAGSGNPQQYYNPRDPSAVESAASSAASTQVTIPNSTWSTVMTSPATQAQQTSTQVCTITDNVYMSELSEAPTYTWVPWLDIRADCVNNPGCTGGSNNGTYIQCTWTVSIDTTGNGILDTTYTASPISSGYTVYGASDPNNSGQVTQGNSSYNGSLAGYASQVIVAGAASQYNVPAGDYMPSSVPATWSVYTYSQIMAANCTANIPDFAFYEVQYLHMSAPTCDTAGGYQYYAPNNMCYLDTLQENIQDGCEPADSNPACQLQSATFDGVSVTSNYNPTGLIPQPSTHTISGFVLTENVTRPWWVKNMVYTCPTGSSYDWSGLDTRMASMATVTTTGTSITYQDQTQNPDGTWTSLASTDTTIAINTSGTSTNCTIACKTEVPATNTQASSTPPLTSADYEISTATSSYYIKPCDSNNNCPVNASVNEQIVQPCQCMNNFGAAAGAVQTVTQASKDLICSSGTPTTGQ